MNDISDVRGTIVKGLDFFGHKTVYTFNVTCPYCDRKHSHGLGEHPEENDKTNRIADCGKGEYRLMVIDSYA